MQIFNPSRSLLDRVGFNGLQPMTILPIPSIDFRHIKTDEANEFMLALTHLVANVSSLLYGERYTKEHNQLVSVDIFLEWLRNCSEHGNNHDPNKYVTIGFWFGEKGILFAFRDEGRFFSLESTKRAMEARSPIPTSRVPSTAGGHGDSLLYEAATDIIVATEENTLYVTYKF